jgi:NCAIR mutase (PurE)-related protein
LATRFPALRPERLLSLLHDVRSARLSVEETARRLADWPTQDLGHTRLDHQREMRCGQPEVVYGAGKSPEQLLEIASALVEQSGSLIVTRIEPLAAARLVERLPGARHRLRASTVERDPGPASAASSW